MIMTGKPPILRWMGGKKTSMCANKPVFFAHRKGPIVHHQLWIWLASGRNP